MMTSLAALATAMAVAFAGDTGPPQEARPSPAPVPAPALLTLDDALALAARHSPHLAAAAARAEGARNAVPVSGRIPNPLFEGRAENWQFSGDLPQDLRVDTFLLLSQPLELGGKRGARRELAAGDARLADASAREIKNAVMVAVASRFLDAVRWKGVVTILSVQQDEMREVTETMRRRVREGFAAEGDQRKFEAELARVDNQFLRAQLELQRALLDLAALMGTDETLPPDRLVEPASSGSPSPFADLDTLVERRPDVAAARARLERAQRARALEQALAVPDLTLSGGYKRTAGVNTGVAAVTVPIPWSDRNQAAVARALAEERAAAFDLDGVVRAARADVEAARRTAAGLVARAATTDEALIAPAETALRAAVSAFREGAGDILRLVDAERVYADARRDALEIKLDAVLASVRARLATGEDLVP